MLDDATFFTPVRALGALLRARKLTSQALTEGCLDRLERLGPKYNAVVTLMRDSALEEARRADREIAAGRARGPLHGIPYGVKDLIATRGVPTTWGAAPYKDQVFDHDATVVERLRAAVLEAAALPADAMRDRLVETLGRHLGTTQAADDRTLVLLRRDARVAGKGAGE